ncbi:hypothetical protein EJB05_26849, partial [Eragrostis curvula]
MKFPDKMNPLNESDSTQLLVTRIFGPVDFCLTYLQHLVVTRIQHRCEGIPLFIIGYADKLKQQKIQLQESSAKYYGDRELAKLYVDLELEHESKLREQLECTLSRDYNDLPVELMLLSQYMSMFSEGYTFVKDCLVMKWISEGLTHKGLQDGSEEEASTYFTELVDRNIIIPAASNWEHSFEEVEPCRWKVNHFILQLFSCISSRTCFVLTGVMLNFLLGPPIEKPGSEFFTPRRLALHSPEQTDIQGLLKATDLAEKTRSLAVSGVVDFVPPEGFIYLVVLDLEGWENLNDEHLLKICNSKMYLLRYLSVKNTCVSKLPPQIKELCYLRMLDISHTQISELPSEVCVLEFFIKLNLRSTNIRKIPELIVRLRQLQYLLLGDEGLDLCEYPASFISDLGDLGSLRAMAIKWSPSQCNDITYQNALQSSFQKWVRLKSLTIHCGLGCSMEFLNPPKKVEKFKVTTGRFVIVPRWIEGLEGLTFLQITVCKLEPDGLKILGDLLKLRWLVLGLEFIPKEEIVIGSEGFCELTKFSVDCPVPWITFKEGAMQHLGNLQLKICSGRASQQSAAPSGLHNLRSLTVVALHYNQKWCGSSSNIKMTVEAVKRNVAEHCNPIDLVINGTNVEDVQKFDEMAWEMKTWSECEPKTTSSTTENQKGIMVSSGAFQLSKEKEFTYLGQGKTGT